MKGGRKEGEGEEKEGVKKKELTIQFMIYHLQHRNKKNSKFYKFQGSRIKKEKKGKSIIIVKEEGREKLLKSLDVHGMKRGGERG